MKISIVGPVKNEVDFIGYSIMAVLPYVHEFVYACASSTDGTGQLLTHIKNKYAGDKIRILRGDSFDFDPHDMRAYNEAFNACIRASTGDAVWFLHPDMIVTNPEQLALVKDNGLAWVTNLTSFAGDFKTKIVKGRASPWKNIHAKRLGLHYYGKYGSQNEDFYHSDITGEMHEHFGVDIRRYPFAVVDSGVMVNHYCEVKPYKRRFEKMVKCLKTLNPTFDDARIEELAIRHPRVTLEDSSRVFGEFKFEASDDDIPEVMVKYKEEFDSFKKEALWPSLA